jgi:hypothetical protein
MQPASSVTQDFAVWEMIIQLSVHENSILKPLKILKQMTLREFFS